MVEGQDFLISRRPNNLKCIGSEFFRICLVGVKGERVVDVIIIYGLVAVEVSVCHLLRFPPRIHQQVSDLPLDLIRDLKPGAEADVDVNVPYIQCLCLRHHLAQIIVPIPSHVIELHQSQAGRQCPLFGDLPDPHQGTPQVSERQHLQLGIQAQVDCLLLLQEP